MKIPGVENATCAEIQGVLPSNYIERLNFFKSSKKWSQQLDFFFYDS